MRSIDNKIKKQIIQKFESGLSMNFIESVAIDKDIGKVKAKHIAQEVIYDHLMQERKGRLLKAH